MNHFKLNRNSSYTACSANAPGLLGRSEQPSIGVHTISMQFSWEGLMEFLNLPYASLRKTVARRRNPPWLFAFSDGKQLCTLVEDWLCQQPLAGKIHLAKISVDSNRRMFEQFGIVSVPTWIFVNSKVEPVSAWIGPWTRGPEINGEVDANALREFLRSRLMR